MKTSNFNLIRYDAEDGKVFDWAQPRFQENENGEQEQIHLAAKTLFLAENDNIENYIEVDAPAEE